MKVYTIVIAPTARKQIDALPPHIKQRIGNSLQVVVRDPFIGKALKADLEGLYSYRVGDYRIIYAIVRHMLMVQVVKVMHRREVYR
ncbi:MAG: type II toxin-antitoxin system RelE/ParE family toxin [Candidatus Omnitrophota bacterium]